jgi:hypothetical protein
MDEITRIRSFRADVSEPSAQVVGSTDAGDGYPDWLPASYPHRNRPQLSRRCNLPRRAFGIVARRRNLHGLAIATTLEERQSPMEPFPRS